MVVLDLFTAKDKATDLVASKHQVILTGRKWNWGGIFKIIIWKMYILPCIILWLALLPPCECNFLTFQNSHENTVPDFYLICQGFKYKDKLCMVFVFSTCWFWHASSCEVTEVLRLQRASGDHLVQHHCLCTLTQSRNVSRNIVGTPQSHSETCASQP